MRRDLDPKTVELLNEICSKLGLFPQRSKSNFLFWRLPKHSEKKTKYAFGYTPHKTKDLETGKKGFFTLKYRILKNGTFKLVKKVRFGRRKIASKRSLEWHKAYYETEAPK